MSAARKLSTMDASFLYLETPEMPMHVGSMAIFKRRDGYAGDFFEDFKQLIESRLHLAPILISKLEKTPLDIDNPSWVVDDQFEIDRHIFRASLPAPADRATLARTVGWMHAKLLNRARPLWEFYVFEGLKDGEIGLYSKVHHACIDGGAGAALTEIVYDVSPTPREVPKAGASKSTKNDFREVATYLPRVLRRALAPSDRSRRPDQADRSAAHRQERPRLDPVRQCDGSDRADDAGAQRPAFDRQDDERDRRRRRSIRNRARVWPA